MKGIDISSYQCNIDFNKVKNSGIEVAYIKATEGVTYTSTLMKSQYSGAKAAGIKIGFYHYLRANNPILEAKHFLGAVERLSSDCKYVIDVEELLGQTITKISSNVKLFTDYLLLNGKQVCIYTGDDFYINSLNSSIKNIPLWVAHYGVLKSIAKKYIGFQYSNSGRVDGINGLVDLNEFTLDIFINLVVVPVKASDIVNLVVKAFQHATIEVGLIDSRGNKLIEDGINGVRTREVIAKVLLRIGVSNELVRWLQHRLISFGFSCGTSGADGNFGGNTLAAVKHFQVLRGLKSDGVIGPLTIIELFK